MRLERPKLYPSRSHGSSHLTTVEKIRSNISSRVPAKIHRGRGGLSSDADSYHNLSYRRPLSSNDWREQQEPPRELDSIPPISRVELDEGKCIRKTSSAGSPKTPTVSTIAKKPVQKVIGIVTSLPSLRGNVSFVPKSSKDAGSRDDDRRHLLSSVDEEKLVGHRFISTKTFAQLHENESSCVLDAVSLGEFDSLSNDESLKREKKTETANWSVNRQGGMNAAARRHNSDVRNQSLRMSPDTLLGLRFSSDCERGSDHSEAYASSARTSSVFAYSTDSNTNTNLDANTNFNIFDDASFHLIDLAIKDHRISASDDSTSNRSNKAGCVKNAHNDSKLCQTVESVLTYDEQSQQSCIASTSVNRAPFSDAVLDIGPQPTLASAQRPNSSIFIPSLGELQDTNAQHEASPTNERQKIADATKKSVTAFREKVDETQSSPIGVDELSARDSGFTVAQEQECMYKLNRDAVASKNDSGLTQKPRLPAASQDEDWHKEDDITNALLQPFRSYTIQDDLVHNVPKDIISSSILSNPIVKSYDDEESEQSRETEASWGSFSQIFSTIRLEEEQESDSESDRGEIPGDASDSSQESVESNPKQNDCVVEASWSDFMKDLVQQKNMSKRDRPLKIDRGCDSMSSTSDLISVLSASLLSSDSDEDTPSVHHILSGESETESSDGVEESEMSDLNSQDFGILNNFWAHEWSDMAATETKNLSEHPPPSRFLLKKEVGCAMEEGEHNAVVCTDWDGNEYIKIYEIDSRKDVGGWCHQLHGLGTVKEECDSDEKESEAGNDEKSISSEKPVRSEVGKLHVKCYNPFNDQTTLRRGYTATQFSSSGEFRRVGSLRKRYIHLKKRAIKKSEIRKWTLVHLEKSTEHKSGSENRQPSLAVNTSWDGILPKAPCTLAEREQDACKVEEEKSSILKESSSVVFDAVAEHENATSEFENEQLGFLKKTSSGEDDGEISLAESSVSIDSFVSLIIEGEKTEKNSFEGGASDQSENNGSRDCASIHSSYSRRPALKRGASLIISKLYEENAELTETLAATQSQLEKVNKKLERIKVERDVTATARFEI